MSALWAIPEDRPAVTLLQAALLACQAGLQQMLAFMAAVYPVVAAGAFLGTYLLALRGIA